MPPCHVTQLVSQVTGAGGGRGRALGVLYKQVGADCQLEIALQSHRDQYSKVHLLAVASSNTKKKQSNMGDHWNRKMKTYFTRIDFDKDGSITRADFEGMAKRFIEAGKLADGPAKQLTDNLGAVWDKYLSVVGGGSAIAQDAFIASMAKLVDDSSLKGCLEGPLPLFFRVIDANSDGLISMEEYGQFFKILGLPDGLADAAFKAIDTDHDGQLSEKEFVTAGSDFFLSKADSHPSDIFWGPLV